MVFKTVLKAFLAKPKDTNEQKDSKPVNPEVDKEMKQEEKKETTDEGARSNHQRLMAIELAAFLIKYSEKDPKAVKLMA